MNNEAMKDDEETANAKPQTRIEQRVMTVKQISRSGEYILHGEWGLFITGGRFIGIWSAEIPAHPASYTFVH